jgi:porin
LQILKTTVFSGFLIASALLSSAEAQDTLQDTLVADAALSIHDNASTGLASNNQDPKNLLKEIERRHAQQQDGLIPYSPLQPFRDSFVDLKDTIYDLTGLRLGVSFHHLFQGATQSLPGTADNGAATDFDFVGTWEVVNQGTPYQGEIVFGIEGRWEYGYGIGPQNLGFGSLGTAGGTANTFSEYDPTFLPLRNLYYRQGGLEAGWVFRIGKITPDAILATNRHITPNTTFLPNAGTGLFVSSYPDSGLGVAGGLYFDDRAYIAAVVSDSNGNRYNWGKLGKGDFFKAVEVGVKIAPRTKNASYSKFTVWHTDGTYNGNPINANTGSDGWGFTALIEQELSDDGNLVLIARYGQSFGGAAIYDQQAGVHLLMYQPFNTFEDDVIGVAYNWINSAFDGQRDEHNLEMFYRFPLLPDVDASVSYQSVFNPAKTTVFDQASVFSFRLTTSF